MHVRTFLLGALCCGALASTLTRLGDSTYYVSTAQGWFVEAEFNCEIGNLQLVRFENEEEHLKFNDTMNSWGVLATSYFVGAIRFPNGLWYWTSTKKLVNYTNWAPNEPNCTGPVCCLTLNMDRQYVAESCCWDYLYICEERT